MTRDEIMALEVGPETDALVAGCVGAPGTWAWKVSINGRWHEERTWIPFGYSPSEPPAGWYAGMMPRPYSTDIRAAMEALVVMEGRRILSTLSQKSGVGRDGEFEKVMWAVDLRECVEPWRDWSAFDPSLPLAICKAILLAMTFENDV